MLHRLAWSQLLMQKPRLLAALAGIAFAVLLQLMQFGFREALFTSSTLLHGNLRADLVLLSTQYEYVFSTGLLSKRRLYQALAVPGVESVAPVHVGMANLKNPETRQERRILVIGFDPNQVVLDVPSVVANARLIRVPDVSIFDALSRPDFGPVVRLFDQHGLVTTEVRGRRTKIRGLFELGVSFGGNGHLITSDSTFRSIFQQPEGVCQLGLVRLASGADVGTVRAALTRVLPNDVRVLTRDELVRQEQSYWNAHSPIGFIFLLGTFVGLLVGAVIVYQILYTDVADHFAEYATLKAMGYTDRSLAMVVLEEAVILSVGAFPIGFGLAELIYAAARNATHLPIEMTISRAVLVFLLTIGMCAAAGLVALRKLRAADPAEVF